jgi:hypothetical protein
MNTGSLLATLTAVAMVVSVFRRTRWGSGLMNAARRASKQPTCRSSDRSSGRQHHATPPRPAGAVRLPVGKSKAQRL